MAELERLGHGAVRNRRAVGRGQLSALEASENDDDRADVGILGTAAGAG